MSNESSQSHQLNKESQKAGEHSGEVNKSVESQIESKKTKRQEMLEKRRKKEAMQVPEGLAVGLGESNQKRQGQCKSESDHSDVTQPVEQSLIIPWQSIFGKESGICIQKLVRKPSYIGVVGGNTFRGSKGHSSVIFKRPILEGKYYIQFKIMDSSCESRTMKYSPAVRVGVCPSDYDSALPLGLEDSICYKSHAGTIIANGDLHAKAEPYHKGDVIGLVIQMSSPHKYPDKKKISEGSCVRFYKNGKLQGKHQELRQQFYSLGVSLFNYSQVEVMVEKKAKFQMGEGLLSYFECLQEKIIYKSLENSKIFAK